jgi:hypothetical protein
VCALTLIMLERAWTLTLISVASLFVSVLLNALLIRRSIVFFGDGGGGVGCAIAALGTHVFSAGAMIAVVGRDAFDRRSLRMVAKSLAACALMVLADRLTASIGWARLAVDAAVYLTVVVATGALRAGETWRLMTSALRGRNRVAL